VDIKEYIESGIIESYVLGLASPEEAAELESLGKQHPEIKQAVDEFALLIQQQAMQDSIMPPAEIKQQLMDALSDEFEAPKVLIMQPGGNKEETGDTKVKQLPSFSFWRTIAAASIILFIISAAMNVYYYNNYKSASDKYEALLIEKNSLQANNNTYQTKFSNLEQSINILQDSAMRVVKMPGVPGKQDNLATVYWDTKTKDVYVLANNLQQTPAGMQYQLWAIVDGNPVDAGLIGDCDGVCKMKNIPKAQKFAITLEKKGGSPTPNLKAMVVLGKV